MDFTALIGNAIQKAGKQETLATTLDMAPSALSSRINGTTGWNEADINKLLQFMNCEVEDIRASQKKISTLKETLKIFMEDGN